jgi:hypothetical protein
VEDDRLAWTSSSSLTGAWWAHTEMPPFFDAIKVFRWAGWLLGASVGRVDWDGSEWLLEERDSSAVRFICSTGPVYS